MLCTEPVTLTSFNMLTAKLQLVAEILEQNYLILKNKGGCMRLVMSLYLQ